MFFARTCCLKTMKTLRSRNQLAAGMVTKWGGGERESGREGRESKMEGERERVGGR